MGGARAVKWLALMVACVLVVPEDAAARRRDQKRATVRDGATTGVASRLSSFSAEDVARLERGKSVKRGFLLDRDGSTYRAGISYRMIDASPKDVIRALRKPGSIAKVIPYGLEARVVSEDDGVTRMRISQGKRPVVGKYTVRMEWDLAAHNARFWMDPNEDADLRDIWGVFSAREIRPGKTLVSFGFAFTIGGVGSLLEGKAQDWGLTTADRIVKYVRKSRY